MAKLNGMMREEHIREVWTGLGQYISRNLRGGRAVKVINFGTFTFSSPEVRLPGVTSPEVHDKRPREPIFLIDKEFIKGYPIVSGIMTE